MDLASNIQHLTIKSYFTTILGLVVFIFNVVILWEQRPVPLFKHFGTYHAILFVAKFQQMA